MASLRFFTILFSLTTCVISSTDGAVCNSSRIINIAVVYHNTTHGSMDWPATFADSQNITAEKSPIRGKEGSCFSLNMTLHYIPLENYSFVYSKEGLHSIRQFDILLGPYSRLVEDLAISEQKLYLITSPVDLSFEERVTWSRDTQFLFPMWPLWSDFLALIKDYLAHIRLEEKVSRLHIVYGGKSKNVIQAANKLHSILSQDALFDSVGLTYFTRYDPREPVTHDRRKLLGQDNPIMTEAYLLDYGIDNDASDLVIGCFDLEDLTPFMRLFAGKHLNLDRSSLKWFIANMVYTTSWEDFSDLGFDYSLVRIASYSRDHYGRGVNRLAAEDAVAALEVALKSLDNEPVTGEAVSTALRAVDVPNARIGQRLKFDENSYRTGYSVTVRNMHETLLSSKPQGKWTSQGRGNPGRYEHFGNNATEAIRVVAVLEHPFVRLKKDTLGVLKGNQRFEGIVVDIMREVAIIFLRQQKPFDYEIYAVPDGKYGMRHPNGSWDGVFRELKEDRARLAIGMISKTKERLTEFNFSPGFAFTGITFIVQTQEAKNIYFQFLRPFEMKVWGGLLVAWLLSSLLIYIFHKWDPFKDNLPLRKKKKVEVDDEDVAPNYTDDRFARDERYNLKESFWYSYLTLAQLGTPFSAYSIPIRTYSVFYWFFALIVVACYTGNLASFLTDSVYYHPHLYIRELMREGYEFGWTHSTSIEKFFVDSPIWDYQEMNREFRKRKTNIENYEHGIAMVKENSNFVYIATHLLLSYYEGLDENCTLHVSQERLDMTELAFPMKSDWDLSDEFTAAMMELREGGHIRAIFNKWLTYSSKCNQESDDDDESVSLDITNFSGLYMVLLGAILLSWLLLLLKIRLGHLSFFTIVRLVLNRRTSA